MTTRRKFMQTAAIASCTSVAALQNQALDFKTKQRVTLHAVGSATGRIRKLYLQTSKPLLEMQRFYEQVLGLKVSEPQENRIAVIAGETIISFTRTSHENPFYHFAFNIPENQILSARNWLVERTPLMPTPRHMIDKGFPDDIRYFSSWNAHSVFFWDPAGNILELIARHDMKNRDSKPFSSEQILCASEIGFVTDDVDKLSEEIKSTFQLSQYRNGSENFRAIGDESGLLLVFKKGREAAGSSNPRKQQWDIFPTQTEIQNRVKMKPSKLPFEIGEV